MSGRWSDAELELFQDGELPGPSCAALSEALRTSPELRARAARVSRADGVYARALELERATPEGGRVPGVRWAGVAMGAGALAVLGVAAWGWRAGGTGGDEGVREAEAYRAVRVVFSLPVREGGLGAGGVEEEESLERPALRGLDEALASGGVEEAIGVVRQAGPGDREEAYRRFGSALRSSETAMAALDALGPEEQVEACKSWIAAGQQRPFALARLRMLGRRPELEASVRAAVGELLADDPSLRTWVMSYLPWTIENS